MTHLMARGGPPGAIKWVIISDPWYKATPPRPAWPRHSMRAP